jgi:hypothetical protein
VPASSAEDLSNAPPGARLEANFPASGRVNRGGFLLPKQPAAPARARPEPASVHKLIAGQGNPSPGRFATTLSLKGRGFSEGQTLKTAPPKNSHSVLL